MATELEKAMMMADLGLGRRDLVSAPDEDDDRRGGRRGGGRRARNEEAQAYADAEAHRKRALEGANSGTEKGRAIAAWNTPSTFGTDEIAEGLENRMSGQGHRRQLELRKQENEYQHQQLFGGPQHAPPRRAPPQPQPPRPPVNYTTTPRDPNRTRAPSPRAAGTVRFGRQGRTGGQAQPAPPGPPNAFAEFAAANARAASATSRPSAVPRTMPPPVTSPSVAPPTPAFNAAIGSPTTAAGGTAQATRNPSAPSNAIPGAFPTSRGSSPSPSLSSAGAAGGARMGGVSAIDMLRAKRAADAATAASRQPQQAATTSSTASSSQTAAPNVYAPSAPISASISAQEHHLSTTFVPGNLPPHLTAALRPRTVSSAQASNTAASTPMPSPASTPAPAQVQSPSTTAALAPPTQRGLARQRATATTTSAAQAGLRTRAIGGPAQPSISIGEHITRPTHEQSIRNQVIQSLAYDAAADVTKAEEFLRKNPGCAEELEHARRKIAQQVVEFAADPDSHEARRHANVWKGHGQLIQLAAQARAGTLSEDTSDPMVRAILEAANEVRAEAVASIEAALGISQDSSSTRSVSSSGSTPALTSPSASQASPASTLSSVARSVRRGFVNAFFYSSDNELIGQRRLSIDDPIRANFNIEAVEDLSDPLELANYMDSWVSQMLKRTSGTLQENEEAVGE